MIKQKIRNLIPNWLVNYGKHLPVAILANIVYGFPSKKLRVIGVTGTDGKTTTATMLYHILHQNKYKVALISTVCAKIGSQDIDTGFHVTSPDHFPLQKLLKRIKNNNYTHVVIEATSHGLAQFRLWGINFTGGIVTNITQDHLLYHKTTDNYLKAKARLFNSTKFAILNKDDKSWEYLSKNASGQIISYGIKNGDYNLNNLKIDLKILGEYNKLNALAALAAAQKLGIDEQKSLQALKNFKGILGRMQLMHDKNFKVIVDFAHTPNALKTVLQELKKISKNKTISVFGCAGLRDTGRRKMGLVSVQNADITIITTEDPRTEGVEKISDEITDWAKKGGGIECRDVKSCVSTNKKHIYIKISDRQQAINFAIKIAQKGDVVGIFGKGHEQSMCYGTQEKSWSDQEAVEKALKLKVKKD
jgi:UDP-N-acetylmuramoyl-L-alanyl-D-glutamate--2,6-diaminopimelate ligase